MLEPNCHQAEWKPGESHSSLWQNLADSLEVMRSLLGDERVLCAAPRPVYPWSFISRGTHSPAIPVGESVYDLLPKELQLPPSRETSVASMSQTSGGEAGSPPPAVVAADSSYVFPRLKKDDLWDSVSCHPRDMRWTSLPVSVTGPFFWSGSSYQNLQR
uniref:Uncharacterized protein n=1 Tax=Gopherus evgoodei TaxID=1825980 RepID=A0A8C4WLB0_9SAUR